MLSLLNKSFNTSYVSVQVNTYCYVAPNNNEFQYILCVGSSNYGILYSDCIRVSIHPMCRFKIFNRIIAILSNLVSIHPMCRFKDNGGTGNGNDNGFQYILCVGSSIPLVRKKLSLMGFNTSYVSVQV